MNRAVLEKRSGDRRKKRGQPTLTEETRMALMQQARQEAAFKRNQLISVAGQFASGTPGLSPEECVQNARKLVECVDAPQTDIPDASESESVKPEIEE